MRIELNWVRQPSCISQCHAEAKGNSRDVENPQSTKFKIGKQKLRRRTIHLLCSQPIRTHQNPSEPTEPTRTHLVINPAAAAADDDGRQIEKHVHSDDEPRKSDQPLRQPVI